MANTIKIKSTEAKVHTIAYAYASNAGGTGKRGMSFRLLPGINEVNADAWTEAKKLVVVQHYIRIGAFQELTLDREGLRHLTVDAAIDQVNGTFDRDLLKKWKGGETREPVISALELQIDQVTYNPDRDSSKSEERKAVEAEDFDLQPRSAAQGMTAAELGAQVTGGDPQAPREEDPTPTPERNRTPAPKTTPPRGHAHGKSHGKGKGK